MPGRTPREAFEAFVDPLKVAIACLVHAKIGHSAGGSAIVGVEHRLFLNRGRNVPLKGTVAHQGRQVRLELGVRMRYKIIADDANGPYRITTIAYDHMLILSSGEVLVNYHWHPAGSSHEKAPHLHLGSSQLAEGAVLTNKLHVPTGRVSVERVIRSAIELGVEPIDDEWDKRLDESEGPFMRYRTWG